MMVFVLKLCLKLLYQLECLVAPHSLLYKHHLVFPLLAVAAEVSMEEEDSQKTANKDSNVSIAGGIQEIPGTSMADGQPPGHKRKRTLKAGNLTDLASL